MRRDSFAVVVIVAWAISMSPPVHSQAARLQISSPRDGTIVQPGSTVAITVTSPAGTLVSSVVVVGQTPLNLFQGSATLPFTTSAMVPVDAPLRRIRLSAMARTPAGREIDVEAAPIFIDVERNDMPTRLSLLNMGEKDPALYFEGPGGDLPLIVLAHFADGQILDATESTRVRYSVAAPGIASVREGGVVTARRAGQTTATIVYSLGTQTLQARVAVNIRSR